MMSTDDDGASSRTLPHFLTIRLLLDEGMTDRRHRVAPELR